MAGEGKFIDNLLQGNLVVEGTLKGQGDNSAKIVALTATNSITASQSGKVFTLGTAGGFTTTLPVPGVGLEFRFIVKVAPTTAYIIATAASANKIYGTIVSGDMDASADTGAAQASDTVTFVANKALIGDGVDFISDGTNWYARGRTKAVDGLTFTQAT